MPNVLLFAASLNEQIPVEKSAAQSFEKIDNLCKLEAAPLLSGIVRVRATLRTEVDNLELRSSA